MKIEKYLTSLLPNFSKDRVIEDCRITTGEIKELTAPAYEDAVAFFKSWKFKSEVAQEKAKVFARMVKGSGSENMILAIEKSFKPALENLGEVVHMVEQHYNEDVSGSGFTYLKANLLQYVECIAFVSKYARKFLNYVYVLETATFQDEPTSVTDSITPAEMEWVEANFVSFCTALNIARMPPGSVKRAINLTPDIVITTENVGTLSSTVGEAKLDPFQMKLIPVWMNPIYHIGMFVAEWQANRYKAAKEEHRLLQLRKLNMEKVSDGKPDARVQKEIQYLESRINAMNYKIAKMEKDNA